MRKSIRFIFIVSMVAILAMLSLPAAAQEPVAVSGTFDYTFIVNDVRTADGNTFVYATEWETWTGDFAGSAEAVFRVGQFSSDFWNVWLRSDFTGSVLGEYEGGLEIQLVGKKPDGEGWYGTWVIIGGTGELANVHGQGIWWGPGFGNSPAIYYSGSITI